tara:strand:- start:3577 stop:4296 length:720 start_codon:yes stop_codon:yes gene_type:complete
MIKSKNFTLKENNLIEQTLIIVPCYNMNNLVQKTIDDLKTIFKYILIIDDYSNEKVSKLNFPENVDIIRHQFNTGQGGAIQTGIYTFTTHFKKCEYLITFDADGQHRAFDAFQMLKKLKEQDLGMVVGTRFKFKESIREIPLKKRFFLRFATKIENLITGLSHTDTHNGLRVIRRDFAEKIELNNFKMAHSTEILKIAVSKKIKITEHPVIIKYQNSGQSIFGSIIIITDLLLSFLFRK